MTSLRPLPTHDDVDASIEPLRAGLDADGYDMEIAAIDDKIRLRIVARDDACEDCLVPKEVMTRIIAAKLQDHQATVSPDDIEITYPVDHSAGT
jgi:hypothetical protein